jgi:hypothetical protein
MDREQSPPRLVRGIGLLEASAANMLNMIGVGPFLTIPLTIAAMGGPQAMLGWAPRFQARADRIFTWSRPSGRRASAGS